MCEWWWWWWSQRSSKPEAGGSSLSSTEDAGQRAGFESPSRQCMDLESLIGVAGLIPRQREREREGGRQAGRQAVRGQGAHGASLCIGAATFPPLFRLVLSLFFFLGGGRERKTRLIDSQVSASVLCMYVASDAGPAHPRPRRRRPAWLL